MFRRAAGAMLAMSKPLTRRTESLMNQNQAFGLLRRVGFSIEQVAGDECTALAGEIRDALGAGEMSILSLPISPNRH
jgi:hypothetical protein